MGEIADMMMESFIDDQLYIFDEITSLNNKGLPYLRQREIQRERNKEKWEKIIKQNEKEGFWQTSKNSNRSKIPFKDLKPTHIKNIYGMLKKLDMYTPAYIKNYVESHGNDVLNSGASEKSLKGKSIIIMKDNTNCSNCPLAYYDAVICEDDGCYGTGKHYCTKSSEVIDYQYKNKMRGFKCPIKDVL